MKGFLATAVRRPVGVTVIYLAIAVFGMVAWRSLAVDLLPEVDVPRITITVPYEGVAPEEIETLITRPIEQATSTIEGVSEIEATSSEGLSRVRLQFTWGTGLDDAMDEVRVALDRVRARLPEGSEPPSIHKFDLASMPVAFLGITGAGDPRRLKYLAQEDISRALERVVGIASVEVDGGRDREIRVSLDSARLTALGVTVEQVSQALAKENRTVSGGDMRSEGREVILRTAGEFTSVDEISTVVVATVEQQPIYLRDVGEVIDTIRRVRGETWIDSTPGIRLRVYKQSGANTVQVAEALQAELVRINRQYEGRAELEMLWDSSEFIRSSVSNVQTGGMIGGLLAIVVLLFFLRSVRATVVVAVAIPVSVLATFGLMFFRGMSLNVISFGGLALGIGMLVDGAIVILESIHRKRSEGLAPIDAAIAGTREVSGAVVAGTVTTVAVFAPVVFVGGFAGVFFNEMAIVVTFALLCSLAVALTLVPMLSARLLSGEEASPSPWAARLSAVAGGVVSRLEKRYERVLGAVLSAPWAVVLAAVVVLGSSVVFAKQIGVELLPQSDEGEIDIKVELPVGTPLEKTSEVVLELEERARSVIKAEELAHIMTTAGPPSWWRPGGSNEGEVEIVLVAASKRERGIDEIEAAVRPLTRNVPGAKILVRQGTSNMLTRIVRRGDDRLAVEVRGHDLTIADSLGEQVVDLIEDVPGITFARPDRELGRLERVLEVDRTRAAELGLGSSEIADAVEQYVLGRVATRYRESGNEFDIRVQLAEGDRERLDQLPDLPIISASGQRVSLGSLVTVHERRGPSAIERLDQERTLRVNLGTADRPLDEIAMDLRSRLEGLSVPDGFTVRLAGEVAQQDETFNSLVIGIFLALFLVFAAMAVQFESARHPLVIMASVPFAFIGVVLALLVTGTTFNMNSFLGVIVLVGIVVNNAIVLVDYTNLLRREQGMEVRAALMAAGVRRLRPILMTTATTLLGLLPLAVGTAEGSEIQGPLARAVVGGLLTSTLVTLLLVPCVYLLVEGRRAQVPRAEPEGAAEPA